MAGVAEIRPRGRGEAGPELDRLYRRYGRDVLRYVQTFLHGPKDAEDVTQSTFLNAYRALQHGVRPRQPRDWLIAIARNECRMQYRSAARRPREVELDDDLAAPSADDTSAEEVRRVLEQLAPKQREALVLREFEGRSYDEIAVALGVSESAVETLLFRARRAVREQLEVDIGCAEAQLLIAADELDDPDRARLRAHVRACRACAKLERRQRGIRGALAKVASVLPLPSWLPSLFGGAVAKTAAVVAVAALAAGGTVQAVDGAHHHARPPAPAPIHELHLRPTTSVAVPLERVPHGVAALGRHVTYVVHRVHAAVHRVAVGQTPPPVPVQQVAAPAVAAPAAKATTAPETAPAAAPADETATPAPPAATTTTPVAPAAETTTAAQAATTTVPVAVPTVTAPDLPAPPRVTAPAAAPPAPDTPTLPAVTTPALPPLPATPDVPTSTTSLPLK